MKIPMRNHRRNEPTKDVFSKKKMITTVARHQSFQYEYYVPGIKRHEGGVHKGGTNGMHYASKLDRETSIRNQDHRDSGGGTCDGAQPNPQSYYTFPLMKKKIRK
jgi:hypothetical protein